MCVTPGEMCTGIDGGVDATDGRVAACGDGIHDHGEVCYGTPITVTASAAAHDAKLADLDGDGDLDLVYLTASGFVYHTYDAGAFGAAADGPSVSALRMLALNVDTDAQAELINASADIELWNYQGPTTSYARTGQYTPALGQNTVAVATGLVNGTRPNVLVLTTSEVNVLTIDAAGALAFFAGETALTDPRDLAAGRIDGDTLADIVIARGAGITLHRATAAGLAAEVALPVTGLVTGVALGDLDNDARLDVVFTKVGASSGTIGAMRSTGAAMFAAPTLSADISDLAPAIETGAIDGDNLTDVVAISTNPKAVLVALGRSDGTLADAVSIAIAVTPTYLFVGGDVNGDAIADIVVTDPASSTIVILPSDP